jgi:hypothetical protein
VNSLQIADVSPASGAPGTSVTITGVGFGPFRGSGAVLLGSIEGQVLSWSDTQVVATVAATSLTGVARIQQNGVWSNAVTFTVPAPGGSNGMTLAPNVLNLVVGDTHTIQALSAAGQSVTGLTWTSSSPNVVSLSTDDPPLLTALAAGHVTITAGAASADVSVWAGALPMGTVLWSNPGDGSGVRSIVPAVPSTTGVADVFAFQNDGTVQAITSDGTTAWTANIGAGSVGVPDFQGGLVVDNGASVWKLDGITGQPYPAYTCDVACQSYPGPAVHPGGTIFVVDGSGLVGIDPTTGARKFSVPETPSQADCEAYSEGVMIAGDGYAYHSYEYSEFPDPDGPVLVRHLMVMRVDTSGNYENIDVYDYPSDNWDITPIMASLITNADQGVLLTWSNADVPGMATITGGNVTLLQAPQLPPNDQEVDPVLQAQDGSFVGTHCPWCPDGSIISFDATGNVRWIVPNDTPQIATADGGVIGQSGITYDQNGNATGQLGSLPTQSWTGNQYEQGPSLESVVAPLVFEDGASFWPTVGGNPSGSGTAIVQCPCLLQSTGVASQSLVTSAAAASSRVTRRAYSSANQKTYLVMAGDPGRNWGPGHMWNQGQLFNLAAATLELSLSQSGNKIIDARVSSFSDFGAALTANGLIDGGVTYFGHGGIDRHGNMALFPGQDAGDANNVSILNVGGLSNSNLGPNASITLNACHAGLGGRRSIAQSIANQLRRTVLAYPVDMYFSSDPTPRRFQKGMVSPSAMPVYMVPNGDGIQPIPFLPH